MKKPKKRMFTLFDYWDKERSHPVTRELEGLVVVGNTIDIDDVTYRVTERWTQLATGEHAVIQMVRYRIPDTATQFVHKCPAKKDAMDKLTREDLIKLEQKQGKKATERMQQGRVKMGGLKTEMVCPFCKCEFWKKQVSIPETVEVDRVIGKRKLKKRAIK